jgi:hypothetical protein
MHRHHSTHPRVAATFTSFGTPGSPSKPSRKDTPGPIPANMLDTCCEAKSS